MKKKIVNSLKNVLFLIPENENISIVARNEWGELRSAETKWIAPNKSTSSMPLGTELINTVFGLEWNLLKTKKDKIITQI